MRLKVISAFVLALFVASCASPEYRVENQDVVAESALKERFKVDTMWWKAYGDPTLNRLVDQALANNIDLKKSAITVNRALYEANRLGEELVPEFSAGLGASASKNLKSGNSTSHHYMADLGVSYEIDLWRKLKDAANAKEWEYKATQQDMETVRLALIHSVVDTYFRLIYLDNSIVYTKQNIQFYAELDDIITNKYRAGKVDELEPLTSHKSLLNAKSSLLTLETNRKLAEQTLRNLLNLKPNDVLDVGYSDLLKTPLTTVDLSVPVAALGLRPDVKAAEYRIQSAFLDWQSVKASLYPSVSIGATIDSSSSHADSTFNVPFLGGAVQINFPFLQYNKIRWNIKISEAQFESAKLDLIETINTALNEVDTYYYSYQRSLRLLENTSSRYDNDVKIAQYNRHRYEAGAEELKEWLNAQCTANQTRLSLLETKYNTINYENAIYKALGARLERVVINDFPTPLPLSAPNDKP